MKLRRDEVFEWLEPPAGGLAALRARLDQEPDRLARRRHVSWSVALAASLLIALLVGLVRPATLPDPGRRAFEERLATSTHPALVHAGLVARSAEAVSVHPTVRDRVAVLRVPVSDPQVDLFLVASTIELPSSAAPAAAPGDR